MPLICQLCQQRPATTHVTEIGPDGTRQEAHLCQTCIREHGLDLNAGPPPLASLAAPAAEAETAAGQPEPEARCPSCGLEFSEYAQNNLFGCQECFHAFDRQVADLARRYHGAGRHAGRVPGDGAAAPVAARPRRRGTRRNERSELERQLREAVAGERFEEAAAVRDRLKELDARGDGA